LKHPLLVVLTFCVFSQYASAQELAENPEKYTAHNKGKFFISWGGNRESYSKSDIHFKGDGYDFTLNNVKADDKPKGYHIDYLNPARMTIPQTNLRLGYFITDHYSVSIGVDHMKYVMRQNQTVNMTGTINGYAPYDGTYNNTPQVLENEFLTFEHTDGLNYVHTEFSRFDDVSSFFNISNTDKIQINLTEGLGGGILFPKTNTKILGKERYDEFHVSGYGVSAKAGINITLNTFTFREN